MLQQEALSQLSNAPAVAAAVTCSVTQCCAAGCTLLLHAAFSMQARGGPVLALSMQHQLVQAHCQHGWQQTRNIARQFAEEVLGWTQQAGWLVARDLSLLLLQQQQPKGLQHHQCYLQHFCCYMTRQLTWLLFALRCAIDA
jgi:hypothetical protein